MARPATKKNVEQELEATVELPNVALGVVKLSSENTWAVVTLKFDHETGVSRVELIEEFVGRDRVQHEFRIRALKHSIIK